MLQNSKLSVHKIIDIGCGTGITSMQMRNVYPNAVYTLCDISENMIHKAKIKIPNAQFMICDAEGYNFVEKYDLGVSNLAMQWFESMDFFLEKILKNCNHFAFSTLLDQSFCEFNNHYPSLEELKNICEKHGTLIDFETKKYVLQFENAFGAARYLRKLGAAIHLKRRPNAGPKSLIYDVSFAVIKSRF